MSSSQENSSAICDYISLEPVPQFQLLYKNISVVAEISVPDPDAQATCSWLIQPKKTIQKTILAPTSGVFSPGTFTAIVGPSGCGKTTMLNLLSGRLIPTKNMSLFGTLSVNGQQTHSLNSFQNYVGYVIQQDLMLSSFTPKQSLQFIASLKLAHKTAQQRENIVASVIKSLGLSSCQDTYIGNNLQRGISGGQRKRTSIGLELLINPSILFLDEPTTGLDSTTAFNLIQLLKALAKSDRTVVSTIHQPSSQIFLQFDKLILMVEGNIVYNGDSNKSMNYFRTLNMPVPIHSNPLDYYMKIMNKQGLELDYVASNKQYSQQLIMSQFKARLDMLISNYKKNQTELEHKCLTPIQITQDTSISWFTEFCCLLNRSCKKQIRSPLAIVAKLGQSLFYAITVIILFEKRAKNFQSFDQNLKGQLFFLAMIMSFGGVFSTVNTFSQERPVLIKQTLSNTYRLSSYFLARLLSEIPMIIFSPFLCLVLCYWVTNLDQSTISSFFLSILPIVLTFWMASAYGFLFSSLIPDPVVVTSMVPVILIPLMLVAGFFTPLTKLHDFFRVFEYISPFKYGYQAFIQIQYRNGAQWSGYDKVTPNILQTEQYDFEEPLWLSLMLLFVLGLLTYILSFFALWIISMPHKVELKPLDTTQNNEQGVKIIQVRQSSHKLQMII